MKAGAYRFTSCRILRTIRGMTNQQSPVRTSGFVNEPFVTNVTTFMQVTQRYRPFESELFGDLRTGLVPEVGGAGPGPRGPPPGIPSAPPSLPPPGPLPGSGPDPASGPSRGPSSAPVACSATSVALVLAQDPRLIACHLYQSTHCLCLRFF